MRRLNSEGIARADLVVALRSERAVRIARAKGLCMLCCNAPVNAVALCEGCMANLTDEEFDAARPWIEGTRT
ncbi:MAG: hypothetical protein ACR2HJ_00450 [Fimbriimonadales bacterium]